MHRPTVIVFDDDESNLKFYQNQFKEDFVVKGFQNAHTYQQALQENVSAILIDVLMPLMNGPELYEKLLVHTSYNGCPIIFVSASTSDEVMLSALKTGGQDFLKKGMKKDEMVIRINNKIDFFKLSRQIFMLGKVKVNAKELKVYCDQKHIDLTLTEFKIMRFLIKEFPSLTTREKIDEAIWPGQKVIPATLNTHLSNLRSKFADWEYEIQFLKSKGVELTLKETPLHPNR